MPAVSSLIFVVILAVWAVYLVQHWVRRRDHLATARSVDRFSEAMRVLERRRALPRPEAHASAGQGASYSSSPIRPARPEVVVKHGTTGATGATAVGPSPAVRRAARTARARAMALLVASAVMVTLVVLGVSGVLAWWWSFVGVGTLAATLLAVRRSVATGRDRRTGRAGRTAAPASEVATTAQAERSPLAAQARATAALAPTGTARRAVDLEATPRPAVYDIASVEASIATQAAEATAAAAPPAGAETVDEPGSWSPTPVPPPTYTLKAKAYRGVPVASGQGAQQLPADGTEMALDEEFEDLPAIDRVV
ncbi:hypothetical protein [Serinicoccus sp. LYQ131]|uniref:hypothetical protein n=1 Tax=Serinicoccus sp. LYQ131 TaxID=3378797 RepID=UPI0038537925